MLPLEFQRNSSGSYLSYGPGQEVKMTFQQMLTKGLKDSWRLRDERDIRKYRLLEYIEQSYQNASNKKEFERCLWKDVAMLVA